MFSGSVQQGLSAIRLRSNRSPCARSLPPDGGKALIRSAFAMHQRLLAVALVLGSGVALAGEPECLKYEPHVVTLTGSVIFRTFSHATGRRERVPLLLLDEPICVEASGSDVNVAEGDQIVVHLNTKPELLRISQASSGPRVTATGTLYHRHTAHHHAALVLMVEELKVENK